MSLNKKIFNVIFNIKFIIFMLIGIINIINCSFTSYLCSFFFSPRIAFIFCYLFSLVIAYILNSVITFKNKNLSFLKLIKFILSYIPNFIIQIIAITVLINIYNFHLFWVYFISAVIGGPISFIILSFYVFRKK